MNTTHLRLVWLMILVVPLITFYCIGGPQKLTEQKKGQIQESCAPIIAWLEVQHVTNSVYPDALPAELVAKLKTIHRHSKYIVHNGHTKFFELWIGDYSKDGWVYYWTSDDKQWHVDN